MYTIVAVFKDGTIYQVGVDIPENEIEVTLERLRRKHQYRYARFEFFTEDD